jgi:hypothetical protein
MKRLSLRKLESEKLNFDARWPNEKALMTLAQDEPFGSSCSEFINHPALAADIGLS